MVGSVQCGSHHTCYTPERHQAHKEGLGTPSLWAMDICIKQIITLYHPTLKMTRPIHFVLESAKPCATTKVKFSLIVL